MKSRFMISTICLVLIFAVLSLAAGSDGSPFKPVYAAPTSVTGPETPIVVNQSDASPYDGVYTGTFNYEYRENRVEAKKPGYAYGEVVRGKWTPAAITATVTLKTHDYSKEGQNISNEEKARLLGFWGLDVTNVIVSDPGFGTGASGVTPVNPGTESIAVLPLDATMAKDSPSIIQSMGGGKPAMNIYFPNGAELGTTSLSVSSGGQTLSGSTWYASGTSSGHFSGETLDHPDMSPADKSPFRPRRYDVREFKNWSLTKVASSVIKEEEGIKLTGVSGEVYVRRGGVGEWTKSDGTVLKVGDQVTTGENSRATIEYPDGDRIDVGPRTHLTVKSEFELLKGKIRALILSPFYKFVKRYEIKAGQAVCAVRGTEFTVSVDEDGTTAVMVLDGSVEVQDLTSHAGILLEASQMVTVPKTSAGLTQEEMLARVKAVQPASIDRWWEKELAAAGKQPVQSPWGIVSVALAVAAVIFLIAGRVFAFLLRRRYGRSTG